MEIIYSLQAQEVICFLLDQVQETRTRFTSTSPSINDFILPQAPEEYGLQERFNQLRGTSTYSSPTFFANNAPHFLAQISSLTRRSAPASGNLYGSQTVTLTPESLTKPTETKIDIEDTLYELPGNSDLVLGDGLIENLAVVAGDLLDAENITKQEEEDVVLEKIIEEYGFEDIKEAFNEGQVPENIYFFMVGKMKTLNEHLNLWGLLQKTESVGHFYCLIWGGKL